VQFLAHYPDTPCLVLGDHDSQPLSCQHKNIVAYLVKPVEHKIWSLPYLGPISVYRWPPALLLQRYRTSRRRNKTTFNCRSGRDFDGTSSFNTSTGGRMVATTGTPTSPEFATTSHEIVAACERLNLHPHA